MTIRLPRPFVDAAVIGSSGDACVIRCYDGQSYYYARRKPGQVALAGLRLVENWCSARDPADPAWTKTPGGTGQAPTVDAGWYTGPDGQPSARKIVFDAGGGTTSNDGSWLGYTIAGSTTDLRVASLWIKSAIPGSPQVVGFHCGADIRQLTVGDEWIRIASRNIGAWTSPRIVLYISGNFNAHAEVLIATDHDHCPQLEVHVPWADTAPAENISPDRDYGFGAPGVAYFTYTNPFTVDTNGVVIDTGARTPISGGGLVVPGAATEIVKDNVNLSQYVTSYTTFEQDTTKSGLFGVPPRKLAAADPGTTDTKSCELLTVEQAIPFDSVSYVFVEKGTTRWFQISQRITDLSTGDPAWLEPRVNLDTLQFDSLFYPESIYESAIIPIAGTNVVFVAVRTKSAADWTNSANLFALFLNHKDTGERYIAMTDESIYVHKAGRVIGAKSIAEVFNALINNHSTTAAASRSADLLPVRWRPGAGWSPGRRLLCRVDLDTRDAIGEGTLLGGVDGGGTTSASLVRVENVSGEYRVSVGDGTATVTVPLALPAGQPAVTVQVDTGPAGLRVAVDGTEYADPTRFDFSWVAETHIGQRPDGSDVCPMAINLRPESWT